MSKEPGDRTPGRLLIVPLFDATLATVLVADAGAASGALSTIQQVGGALGIAAIGAIFYTVVGGEQTTAGIVTGLHAVAWGCVVAYIGAAVASLFLLRAGKREEGKPVDDDWTRKSPELHSL